MLNAWSLNMSVFVFRMCNKLCIIIGHLWALVSAHGCICWDLGAGGLTPLHEIDLLKIGLKTVVDGVDYF